MEWVESTIGEVCDVGGGVVKTGPFGTQLHQSDYEEDGIPVVMPKDIIDGYVDEATIARVSEDHVHRLSKHKLSEGDIVYGRRGDIGRQALVRKENIGWLCGTGCLRITLGSAPIDCEFLHLYLRQPDVIKWISNHAIGATMPNLNTSILRGIPIRFPKDKDYQKELAGIVTTYDNLIENNNRRIAILEEMAQSLYCEWFVKFRFPGFENTEFIDSPLGKIPEGWVVMSASEAIDINPRTKLLKEGEKPFVPMSGLSESSMSIGDIQMKSGNSGAKYINGDTLFARITPCLENGKTGYVQFLDEVNPVGFGSTEFIVLRPKILNSEFIYVLARSDSFRDHAMKSMTGATGRQRVQNTCFNNYKLAVPTEKLLSDFQVIIKPMYQQIYNLCNKNMNLRNQRNMLLPKLISGTIEIKE